MLDINKQGMFYSIRENETAVYATDESGETLYVDVDGESVPVETGETKSGYSAAVFFRGNLSASVSEATLKDFGIDDSGSYSQIITDKGELPLSAGDLIWRKSGPYISGSCAADYAIADTSIIGEYELSEADYMVKGVADEGLTTDIYLLKRNI